MSGYATFELLLISPPASHIFEAPIPFFVKTHLIPVAKLSMRLVDLVNWKTFFYRRIEV